jgi:glucan phosphorylase
MGTGVFSPREPGRYRGLLDSLINFGDHYQVLADYRSYVDCQDKVDALYRTPEEWTAKAMLNITWAISHRTVRCGSMRKRSGISTKRNSERVFTPRKRRKGHHR